MPHAQTGTEFVEASAAGKIYVCFLCPPNLISTIYYNRHINADYIWCRHKPKSSSDSGNVRIECKWSDKITT